MQGMTIRGYSKENFKVVFNMAWPAVVESFFVAFAGLVDSLMVSRMGSYAVAAVGLTTQPKFMGLALFFAVNVSISALVARRFGAGQREDANCVFRTALTFVIAAAVVLSVLFVAAADPIIRLCGSSDATPEDLKTHEAAVIYFWIIMGGMIFNCIQMAINSAQRGAGNTRITMRTNVTSNLVNIVLNYLLIEGHFGFPALGIVGAALATVLGTVVSSVMSVCSIMNSKNFISIPYILTDRVKASGKALKSLIRIGYGIFFEQILMRIGFMATAVMAAKKGMDAMAAHQVGMNLMGLTFSFGDGLQAAAVALIGRSLGQGKPELAKDYGRTCRALGMMIAAVLILFYFFGAGWLMSMFFKEEHIIEIGVSIMRVIIFIVLFQIIQVIYMGCLRGAGDTLYTAFAATMSVTVIRTLVSWLGGFVFGLGIVGIWLGVLADQVSRFTFASIRYRMGKWVKIRI
ncbi:MAG: MATE family efflux transporter [Lachnospiraceae bacterium]|nr:MATE family efflux transporter [Lachnospiraceae bacterium]